MYLGNVTNEVLPDQTGNEMTHFLPSDNHHSGKAVLRTKTILCPFSQPNDFVFCFLKCPPYSEGITALSTQISFSDGPSFTPILEKMLRIKTRSLSNPSRLFNLVMGLT